jgi:hypothetical protein
VRIGFVGVLGAQLIDPRLDCHAIERGNRGIVRIVHAM